MFPWNRASGDVGEGRIETVCRSLSWLSNRMVNDSPAGTARQSRSNLWPEAVSASDVPAGAQAAAAGRSAADADPVPGPAAASTRAPAAAPNHPLMAYPLPVG